MGGRTSPVIGGGFASTCETTPDNLHLTHGNDYFFIQVAMSIAEREAEEREYRALASAKDHYPQYLFTLDTLLQKRDGVRHVNIIDFITEGRDL